MRILWVLNTPGFLRYYDETIDALLARGHEVVVGFTNAELRADALRSLETRPRRPRLVGQVPVRADRYGAAAVRLRGFVDFARYLDPRLRRAAFLRDRRRARIVEDPVLAPLFGRRDSLPAPLARALVAGQLRVERALPSAPDIEAWLRGLEPDVVLVSPLVTSGSSQTDYVKSAQALGIPTGLCVASWDNLTNKGLVRVVPERVFVWNAAQRREAVELHGVPEERVVLTGAQPFDRWFGRGPATSRAAFCARVGLDPARPFVLFVGSTDNILAAAEEDAFIRRWAEAIRAAPDPALAQAGILVRPHPDRRGAWTTEALDGVPGVVVWPPERPNSVMPSAREEYFDSLFHSAAIVGINTSAMVEGAVIDRPVLTLRLPEFRLAQEGTLHFDHLLPANGGPLLVASSVAEHGAQLAGVLADPARASADNRRFAAAFIRPQGLDVPSDPLLVAGIEGLRDVPARPARTVAARPLRALVLGWLELERRLEERERRPAPRTDRRVEKLLKHWAARVAPRSPAAARRLRAAARVARELRRGQGARAKLTGQERKREAGRRRALTETLKRGSAA